MKHLILPAALLLTLGGTAFAQAPASTDMQQNPAPIVRKHDGKHGPHAQAMKMSQELNLTADQTAKLEPILADREAKVKAIKSNTALSEADAKQQMKAVHKASEQQLATVLTPDQLTQLKSEQHKGHKKGDTQPLTPPAAPPQA